MCAPGVEGIWGVEGKGRLGADRPAKAVLRGLLQQVHPRFSWRESMRWVCTGAGVGEAGWVATGLTDPFLLFLTRPAFDPPDLQALSTALPA